jgi:hypothetical protein
VAVLGSTRAVGWPVVPGLRASDLHITPLSRRIGVEVRGGAGLACALDGVDAAIGVA